MSKKKQEEEQARARIFEEIGKAVTVLAALALGIAALTAGYQTFVSTPETVSDLKANVAALEIDTYGLDRRIRNLEARLDGKKNE